MPIKDYSHSSQVILSLYPAVKFTKTHEWVESVDAQKRVRIGITDFAQSQLG